MSGVNYYGVLVRKSGSENQEYSTAETTITTRQNQTFYNSSESAYQEQCFTPTSRCILRAMGEGSLSAQASGKKGKNAEPPLPHPTGKAAREHNILRSLQISHKCAMGPNSDRGYLPQFNK